MIYDDLAYAVTHCGLSPDAFHSLTPEEWSAIAEAQIKREEQEIRTSWEQTRSIMYASSIHHIPDRPSAQELFPLPWDVPPGQSPPYVLSEEELEEMEQRYT